MKLLYTPTSPYVRKVRVLAHERGLELAVHPVDPHHDDPQLLAACPVGKVPVLLLDDGTAVQDSRVICAYLESKAGRPLPPVAQQAREALAEAILDAAVVVVMERRRPEAEQSARVVGRQIVRIHRIVDTFNAKLPPSPAESITLEQIGTAVSLAYLDFRLPELQWRDKRPELAGWFEMIASRPSMDTTKPPTS